MMETGHAISEQGTGVLPSAVRCLISYINVLLRFSHSCFDSTSWARVSSLSRLHDHTQTHHIPQNSSEWVIGQTQRLPPDYIRHSQERDIHDPRRDSNP